MSNISWHEFRTGIGSVALMAGVVSVVYQWATRIDPGGPFSDILSAIGVIGAVALALLGGGLLGAVGWIFAQIGDSDF